MSVARSVVRTIIRGLGSRLSGVHRHFPYGRALAAEIHPCDLSRTHRSRSGAVSRRSRCCWRALALGRRSRTTSPTTSSFRCSSSRPGPACSCCPRAARGDERSGFSADAARAISTSRAPMRRCATRQRCGSDRQHQHLRGRRAPRRTRGSSTRASRCRPTVPSPPSRRRSRMCTGAAPARRPRPLLEPALLDVLLRVSDPLRPLGVFDPSALRAAGAAGARPRCVPAARRAPRARSNSTAIPGSCGSIRAGTRRRCASSSPASATSSRAPTTCCSSCAWSSRSGGCGPLALIVTAFTVAHSITLIASAFGFAPDALWFPPLVETLIAVSILYMALENIVGSNLQRGAGSSPSRSAWCTASVSRSPCANRCSSPDRTC